MAKKTILWLLTICCVVGIFLLSSQPATESDKLSKAVTESIIKKTPAYQDAPTTQKQSKVDIMNLLVRDGAHVFVFLAVAFFLSLLLCTYGVKAAPALAALICACYAVIDELYQQFFSAGRGFEFADIAKDWVGIIAGTAIAVAVLAIRKALKSR